MSNNLQNIKTDCMTGVQYNSISDNVLVLPFFGLHDRFRYFLFFTVISGQLEQGWVTGNSMLEIGKSMFHFGKQEARSSLYSCACVHVASCTTGKPVILLSIIYT